MEDYNTTPETFIHNFNDSWSNNELYIADPNGFYNSQTKEMKALMENSIEYKLFKKGGIDTKDLARKAMQNSATNPNIKNEEKFKFNNQAKEIKENLSTDEKTELDRDGGFVYKTLPIEKKEEEKKLEESKPAKIEGQ
jgi:hypothetical protein